MLFITTPQVRGFWLFLLVVSCIGIFMLSPAAAQVGGAGGSAEFLQVKSPVAAEVGTIADFHISPSAHWLPFNSFDLPNVAPQRSQSDQVAVRRMKPTEWPRVVNVSGSLSARRNRVAGR